MLSFLRGLLSTGQQSYESAVAAFAPRAWLQALRQTDDRVEFITKMEQIKRLCETYEQKLDETEKNFDKSSKNLDEAEARLRAAQERAILWVERTHQARSEANEMRKKVMRAHHRSLGLEAEARKSAEESAQSTKARIKAEEKSRRLEEVLKETRKLEGLVSKENKGLVVKLARLQRVTECMNDDEVRRTMRQLYQELEDWIKCHLLCSLQNLDEDGSFSMIESSLGSKLQTLHEIQTEIYGLVFHSILRRFFVGISHEPLEGLFRKLDHEVLANCPEHTWHHWITATSSALFSLLGPDLYANCDQVIQIIEARFATRSGTDAALRTQELRCLLWKFVEFKNRLERQNERYAFWWVVPGMPFNEENMSSLSGEYSADSIVQFGLSPMVFKSSPSQEKHTIVQKADVKLMPRTVLAEDSAITDGGLQED